MHLLSALIASIACSSFVTAYSNPSVYARNAALDDYYNNDIYTREAEAEAEADVDSYNEGLYARHVEDVIAKLRRRQCLIEKRIPDRRVGGATYPAPVEVRPGRKEVVPKVGNKEVKVGKKESVAKMNGGKSFVF